MHRAEVRVVEDALDVRGGFHAHRLSVLHMPVVQLNTDNGFGGECHLDDDIAAEADSHEHDHQYAGHDHHDHAEQQPATA